MRPSFVALTLFAVAATSLPAQAKPFSRASIDAAVAAPTRTPANTVRDQYRHPAETLAFFGIKPDDKIVEIWPFGGWFTEILAPFTNAGGGTLTVASPPGKYDDMIAKKIASDQAVYGKVVRTHFPADDAAPRIAPNSVDAVLTFRNIHNWTGKPGGAEAAFAEMFAMLKPGGVLGVEDHRLPENMDTNREAGSGYLKVSTVRALAQKAGFQFAGSSEVNANPRDTHDYPKGVWTLPPSYAEGDKDRARYAAIGESDRMTLKFIKPRK